MKIIGHRGCRGLYPENTLISFIEAIKMGVHAIELDVVVSGDGKIVVSHEPFMSQITCLKPDGNALTEVEDKMYNFFKMTYDEIKTFDCGLKQHPKFPNQKSTTAYKPLLSETIEVCDAFATSIKSSVDYVIEIKSDSAYYGQFYPNPKEYVALILETLDGYAIYDRIVLKSFDIAVLNELKKVRPKQKISLLINREESIENKLQELTFIPEILGPYFKLLDKNTVTHYKAKGFEIYPWTINELTDMQRIMSYGVDGIIMDYPNRVFDLV